MPIVDELVSTVLSQHTNDLNTARACTALKARYPTWEKVLDAPSKDLADTIRAGGLADLKAPRIQAILRAICEREGRLDLARLNDLSDGEADEYLQSLPGVGPKTAACVLVFSMGRSAFPIDTHVHRVSRRLGLIDDRTSAEAASRELPPRVPPDIRYRLHAAFVDHGRRICMARNPRCSRCVLFDLCVEGPKLAAAGMAR
jgi:endonuclease III